jgi:hypothetical protein
MPYTSNDLNTFKTNQISKIQKSLTEYLETSGTEPSKRADFIQDVRPDGHCTWQSVTYGLSQNDATASKLMDLTKELGLEPNDFSYEILMAVTLGQMLLSSNKQHISRAKTLSGNKVSMRDEALQYIASMFNINVVTLTTQAQFSDASTLLGFHLPSIYIVHDGSFHYMAAKQPHTFSLGSVIETSEIPKEFLALIDTQPLKSTKEAFNAFVDYLKRPEADRDTDPELRSTILALAQKINHQSSASAATATQATAGGSGGGGSKKLENPAAAASPTPAAAPQSIGELKDMLARMSQDQKNRISSSSADVSLISYGKRLDDAAQVGNDPSRLNIQIIHSTNAQYATSSSADSGSSASTSQATGGGGRKVADAAAPAQLYPALKTWLIKLGNYADTKFNEAWGRGAAKSDIKAPGNKMAAVTLVMAAAIYDPNNTAQTAAQQFDVWCEANKLTELSFADGISYIGGKKPTDKEIAAFARFIEKGDLSTALKTPLGGFTRRGFFGKPQPATLENALFEGSKELTGILNQIPNSAPDSIKALFATQGITPAETGGAPAPTRSGR